MALGALVDGEPTLHDFLYFTIEACQSRRIIGPVQFEDTWQSHIIDNLTPQVFIEFKFSPIAFRICTTEVIDLNQFSWALILPNLNYLDEIEKPKDAVEYLMLSEIYILSKNEDSFSEQSILEFIDQILMSSSN